VREHLVECVRPGFAGRGKRTEKVLFSYYVIDLRGC